jgi:hypothetical protein
VILGIWKLLGAAALLAPRRPLLKEWAYAGAFFVFTGALVSDAVKNYGYGEIALLIFLIPLTVVSWALRPASRRTPRAGDRSAVALRAGKKVSFSLPLTEQIFELFANDRACGGLPLVVRRVILKWNLVQRVPPRERGLCRCSGITQRIS